MIQFSKAEGAGNDFVLVPSYPPADPSALSQILCDRRRGIGADGVIWLERLDGGVGPVFRDGSRMKTCINGFRCAARVAAHLGWTGCKFHFLVDDRAVEAEVTDASIALELEGPHGSPIPLNLPPGSLAKVGHAVWSGDPHLVIELERDAWPEAGFAEAARSLRWWKGVSDAGTNVHFVAADRANWLIRSYERGVEEETLACGSGCMAAALVISRRNTRPSSLSFLTRGGDQICVQVGQGQRAWRVSGPARVAFEGSFDARDPALAQGIGA